MKLRAQTSTTLKAKLSSTLKSWLPILQSGMGDLEETLNGFGLENPYFEVKSGIVDTLSTQSIAYKKQHKEKCVGLRVVKA